MERTLGGGPPMTQRSGSGARRFPLALARVDRAGAAPTQRELLRPQRLLREAAQDAARRVTPSGLGLDSALVRSRMVGRLRAAGIRCEPVLAAMALVPRHAFVDSALANQAYEDTSLPIGHGQTISKPWVVARMLELLFDGTQARRGDGLGRVLEIGTGCGYQTALLARLSRHVVSIERLRPLYDKALERLTAWRTNQVRLVHGDGRLGHAPNAPYDAIIAAAGGTDLPGAWLDQLALGGRLVAPMQGGDGRGQVLVVVDRRATGCVRSQHEAVHFVPLKSGVD